MYNQCLLIDYVARLLSESLIAFSGKVIICTSFGYDIHQLFSHLSMNPRDSSGHYFI